MNLAKQTINDDARRDVNEHLRRFLFQTLNKTLQTVLDETERLPASPVGDFERASAHLLVMAIEERQAIARQMKRDAHRMWASYAARLLLPQGLLTMVTQHGPVDRDISVYIDARCRVKVEYLLRTEEPPALIERTISIPAPNRNCTAALLRPTLFQEKSGADWRALMPITTAPDGQRRPATLRELAALALAERWPDMDADYRHHVMRSVFSVHPNFNAEHSQLPAAPRALKRRTSATAGLAPAKKQRLLVEKKRARDNDDDDEGADDNGEDSDFII